MATIRKRGTKWHSKSAEWEFAPSRAPSTFAKMRGLGSSNRGPGEQM